MTEEFKIVLQGTADDNSIHLRAKAHGNAQHCIAALAQGLADVAAASMKEDADAKAAANSLAELVHDTFLEKAKEAGRE